MRNLIAVFGLVAVVCLMTAGPVGAAEKAATEQLPAALLAVGGEQSQVVTAEEAQQVRGQWFWATVDMSVWNYVTSSYVALDGPASYMNVYIDPFTYVFEIY